MKKAFFSDLRHIELKRSIPIKNGDSSLHCVLFRMKNRINVLFVAIVLILSTALSAQSLSFNGYVRNYTGVLTSGDNEYSILQNTFNLNVEHSKDMVSFKANPFLYYYTDSELELGLREVYMDIFFDSIDLRIGKQQIIWGKADGVFITDIISPKDLREFLLPDFDEIRTGVTAVKANYYNGDNTLEFVWLPSFTPTAMPEEGSLWFPQLDFPIQPEFDNSKRNVEASLQNSEIFAKYSALTSFADFEIMAGYAWDDDPTMHITKTIDPQTMQLTGLTVFPQHHRLTIAGGSFSTTVSGVVLRGEGAFYSGKYFNTADPAIHDAVVQKDYIHYLIGMDYSLWDINISGQFIQQAILDYDKLIDQDEFENTMTFLARRDFLRETLTFELFTYVGLNNNDALIRPRLLYDLSDGFEVQFGANIFTGDEGSFGQYDQNDMIYTKFKYSF
ncbi:MAG: hypothetical protein D8M58_07500 [Calditrichaeota bacterium]|nr:MAG: hypothetical protein DWQ03_18990 [Calditrichota bacterium]MBL1205226.1 hypothetical protein [Calditrichota bacterium]NOG45055.1 hypothetical protein [Calditrichota bacterium]